MSRIDYLLAHLLGNDLSKEEAIELYDEIIILIAENKRKQNEGKT